MKHAALLLLALLLVSLPVAAQEQTGALKGKVTDSSAAVLPGVTVTITGPTILGGSRSVVTTETGVYRIPNIPIGTYTVSFELAGFETKAFEGIRIQAFTGFTLDALLGMESLKETVTVSGETPIIDTAATNLGFTFTKELMSTVPNARDLWAMVAQTPGLVSSTVNVGGTQTGNQTTFRGHGVDPRQSTYILNGAPVTDFVGTGNSQYYYDIDSFEEVQVEVNSHNAEVQTSGIMINMVPKSGMNTFRASSNLYYSTDSIQSDNMDDALRARGVDRASNLHVYADSGLELSGPILKDKVWFWSAFRWQETRKFITGTKNPDGTFPIDRLYLWYPSANVNWLVTPKHNLSTFFNMQQKKNFNRGLSALRPLETTNNQRNNPVSRLVTVRDDWTASPNLLISVKGAFSEGGYQLDPRPDVDTNTTPASQDLATGRWWGAPPSLYGADRKIMTAGGTASYYVDEFLGGHHDFKFGFTWARYQSVGTLGGNANTVYPADARLLFYNGQPLQVMLFQSGTENTIDNTRSAFAQDSWKAGRFALNYGVRWDWQANRLGEATAPKSRYLDASISQRATGNLITWNSFAPRVGIIYDVRGDSKTLVKASYSRYNWQLWIDKGGQASTAGTRTYTYQWIDRNADGAFKADEIGTLVSVDDPSTRPVTIDSNLKQTKTDEIIAGLSHALMANVSVGVSFMYRRDKDLDWKINPLLSPADYRTVTGTDPGPDGMLGTADDGGALIFYEVDAAKRALSPNFITTRPGFIQDYRGVEFTAQHRLSHNWQMVGSLTIGSQREGYGAGSYQNPQDVDKMDATRIASSIPYITKLMGSYALPYHITLSGYFQRLSGTHYTRTVNSQSALGRSLNQGNVAILSGTRNEASFESLNLLDFRLNYDLPLARVTTSLALDVFNVLNINTITNMQTLSGSAYQRVIDFIPPRILRFGVKVRF
jgi:hypothetical protein